MPDLFAPIAARYDFANHILSGYRDRAWRRWVVKRAAPKPDECLLDLCTGTGDLALEFARLCPELEIVGLDISLPMLQVAREKLIRLGLENKITLQQGDALHLSFDDSSFDLVTVAFGVRNLPDRLQGLREIYRVLKPNGRAFILEFSLPQSLLLRSLYLVYLRYFLPNIGGILTGSRASYAYLRDSIDAFPARAQILCELHELGFRPVGYEDLTGGIATLYWGGKASC
ncbi:bifunctional demethylmenaquinone methyltransferase/2-methoxy-6-polyprenyl-1,4-benzoquinol methylase UbiE [Candidatus Acetothermia bacterium]|jgi:demethylmenaquinone methyltransferase/2-methoxy-6-polyprenyl-1,4-benzoquinol methylase|nr:bifunctional demethylmenaquinone methyltransferase/2-methoxy-6-polyprenyl-1,4-benzoquinol methylase UbiE [Candidatus Acetothermia bacterium]MCI2431061.1 bifunctional demethylmenaquinone methyltransferase/2-methoxy-6-polyprenyl-1,4-benzoquinol methylase UbiE [Candidatus Acetothermia bacterium]MCI2435685.1 bifunctional demethylmenaquinone methyltransferase/2-methoxy-6-polyprenyl-1,4-benzoquinol methylase UbiE [Candidatus Acetothermia bacterium]